MFFEIWKKVNKKKLDKLNKIAPYIKPSEQTKKIANEIAKQINKKDIKININKKENRIRK